VHKFKHARVRGAGVAEPAVTRELVAYHFDRIPIENLALINYVAGPKIVSNISTFQVDRCHDIAE